MESVARAVSNQQMSMKCKVHAQHIWELGKQQVHLLISSDVHMTDLLLSPILDNFLSLITVHLHCLFFCDLASN